MLRRLIRDPGVRRTGFAESDIEPGDILGPEAMVWRIESAGAESGLVWLDTCREHRRRRECGLLMTRRGVGLGPRVLLAVLMYACARLSVTGVCFFAKEWNWQVIEMCRRAGIAGYDRRSHRDDFHPDGASDLVCFVIDWSDMVADPRRCRALLRTPVTVLDTEGRVEFVASQSALPRVMTSVSAADGPPSSRGDGRETR